MSSVTAPSLPRGANSGLQPGASRKPAGVSPQGHSLSGELRRVSGPDLVVPLSVIGIVLAMITPLPPLLVDILISLNISLSLVILLVAMYIRRPVEFSVFPAALLLTTLFRLALNVSSSRLILLDGNKGTRAAGQLIEAFGSFVVGGNYIVGLVIFLVLIAIQYVVINHGAVRISEVTARFTLDALPGKQMSIDSDLNAGLIDEAEARSRRRQLAGEAEFYGAMDGASRFTQRDAVASILITAINIVAGFLVGVLQHGMELKRALTTYTVLTIGDGLVTVIPALMISVSGGLVVTRASSEAQLGAEFRTQLLSRDQPLLLTSGVLALLALFPGMPTFAFLLASGGAAALGWRVRQKNAIAGAGTDVRAHATTPAKDNLESLLRVEPLSMEVGLGLVKLVEGGAESPLLRRIAGIRRQLAAELGFLLPPVRVSDNLSLKPGTYTISLKGVEIGRCDVPPGRDLAIPSGQAPAPLDGIPGRDPAFGIAAFWILPEQAAAARQQGYTIVDPVSVLGTHLGEIIRRHAHELFSRQDTKKFLDRVSEENPRVVEDLVPKLLPMSAVQRVIQNLLRERVSIRDAVSILEALSEAAAITKNTVLLTEYVRQAIRRMVVQPHLNAAGELHAFLVSPRLEQSVESAVEHGETTSHLNLPPQQIRDALDRIGQAAGGPDATAVLLAGSGSRYFLRQITETAFPGFTVLAHSEIPPGVRVVSLGTVGG